MGCFWRAEGIKKYGYDCKKVRYDFWEGLGFWSGVLIKDEWIGPRIERYT